MLPHSSSCWCVPLPVSTSSTHDYSKIGKQRSGSSVVPVGIRIYIHETSTYQTDKAAVLHISQPFVLLFYFLAWARTYCKPCLTLGIPCPLEQKSQSHSCLWLGCCNVAKASCGWSFRENTQPGICWSNYGHFMCSNCFNVTHTCKCVNSYRIT